MAAEARCARAPDARILARGPARGAQCRVARATGASRSELIRRAVRSAFGEKTKAERFEALSASAGSWSGKRLTGADYVDGLRGDLDERLRRLGVE